MKTIIVGINPSGAKQRKASTIDRLNKWLAEANIPMVSFANCIHAEGEYKYEDVDYDFLVACVTGYDKVVALGSFASTTLKRINIPHIKIDHPSPRNRNLNSREYELKMIERLREYVHGY